MSIFGSGMLHDLEDSTDYFSSNYRKRSPFLSVGPNYTKVYVDIEPLSALSELLLVLSFLHSERDRLKFEMWDKFRTF